MQVEGLPHSNSLLKVSEGISHCNSGLVKQCPRICGSHDSTYFPRVDRNDCGLCTPPFMIPAVPSPRMTFHCYLCCALHVAYTHCVVLACGIQSACAIHMSPCLLYPSTRQRTIWTPLGFCDLVAVEMGRRCTCPVRVGARLGSSISVISIYLPDFSHTAFRGS